MPSHADELERKSRALLQTLVIDEKRCMEFVQCIFHGGSAGIDANGKLLLIPAEANAQRPPLEPESDSPTPIHPEPFPFKVRLRKGSFYDVHMVRYIDGHLIEKWLTGERGHGLSAQEVRAEHMAEQCLGGELLVWEPHYHLDNVARAF